VAGLAITRRGVRRHPAFAFDEPLRPGRQSGPEPDGEDRGPGSLAELNLQIERLGKSVQRLSIVQEAGFRDIQERIAGIQFPSGADAEKEVRALAHAYLPVIDSLHRIVEATGRTGDNALAKGALLVLAKGQAYLKALGAEAIPALGTRFDPHVHQALETRPAAAETRGKVLEEITRGYRIGNHVLRPSQVVVGWDQGVGF